ncbi:MAG: peptidoglycan-associated lipoprotein [SAR86 cluster bacterium]|uniref:Peptidoglycan-associated lipoprotein n=1 Tax=SAR86 cluster bacterium TaxID=2030880 RepID=A0A2A5CE99_9GAMM|nr:MAG: peptidoglycan-associated lipoprotein [SAR86 cluster bacterium]
MRNNKFYKLSMVAAFTLFLAACGTTTDDMGDGSDSGMGDTNSGSMGDGDNTGRGNASGAGDNMSGLSAAQMRERESALATTVFYFDFDRSDLSSEAREALVHHANRLMENSSLRYRLEGHADERGTREYNLALGERRAQAIERYLQVQGVSSNQLEVISYGEEQPIDPGSSDAAHARNRRVEIQ